ncbi:hypothetical protein [Lichenicoccus sp.]|uniref:hypothetical protein n=1 Tax=Lichenicoccus sp. TaxID=2781899 RepID=UPI003D0E051F
MSIFSSEENATQTDDQLAQENLNDLARIIVSEAGGENETAQAMVGWTVVNRMTRGQITRVSQVWANGNYSHSHMTTLTTLHLAERILSGAAIDISQDATYFYSPKSMAKEGERPSSNADVRGGLESVPGVMAKNGRLIRNHRPGWVQGYSFIRIPGVQDKDFKFYRS